MKKSWSSFSFFCNTYNIDSIKKYQKILNLNIILLTTNIWWICFFIFLGYVELYLERIFYNLTVVALHDCYTYNAMTQLALQRYGLILCESRLPYQSLHQSLDILVVTRHLQSFVASYNYNLNGQVRSGIFKFFILCLNIVENWLL